MKEPKILLEHILECINYIEEFIHGLAYEDFRKLVEKQDAVQRRLEIIGEAVKNLPESLKDTCKEIPWKNIASMRDLLIHEYFDVSSKQVWIAITQDLPLLKVVILKMIEDCSSVDDS